MTVTLFVEVKARGKNALLVTDGDIESWVPFAKIDPDSEISEDSEVGDEGYLTIPQWLAENDGLV